LGLKPAEVWDMTFHEVASFSRSHDREERARWMHTATVCALLANCHRGKNRRPYKAADFYPFDIPKVEDSMTAEDVRQLIEEFSDGR